LSARVTTAALIGHMQTNRKVLLPAPPASTDGQIEITLADGTMVRAGQNVSLATLRRVLAALRG
jgi:hypothetical protein